MRKINYNEESKNKYKHYVYIKGFFAAKYKFYLKKDYTNQKKYVTIKNVKKLRL